MTVQLISGLQIRQDVGVERDWVFLGAADAANNTTTFISDTQRLKGPIFPSTFMDDAIVRIASGPRAGERTTLDHVDPDAGGLVLSPALTGALASGDQYEVWLKGLNPDVFDRERDFALTRICSTWRPQPVSLVTDGDYEAAPMSDVSHFTPAGGASVIKDYSAFPDAHFRRVLRVSNAGANGYVQTDAIKTQIGEQWFVEIPVSAAKASGNGSGTAQVQVVNITTGALIVLGGLTQVNNSNLAISIGRGWGYISLLFTTPNNCDELAIRLGGSETDAIIDYGPINCHRYNHTRIGLPDRITTIKRVGHLYVTTQLTSASIQIWDFRSKLQNWHNWNRQQVGNRVEIWGSPPMTNLPYFFMERGYFDALQTTAQYYTIAGRAAGDAATTDCPKEYIEAAVAERVSKMMMKRFPDDPQWQAQWIQDSTELSYWEDQFGPEPQFIFENEEPFRVLQLNI